MTLHPSIERPKALDTDAIMMSDLDLEALIVAIRFAMAQEGLPQRPAD